MRKILLIDDEVSIVEMLSIFLEAEGYGVIPTFSGPQGLEQFKSNIPEIVITDLKMPGMSGLEVIREIKKINPDTEVIIITGHGDMNSAIEALELGASDFINKPIIENALLVAIERAKEKLIIKKRLKEYTADLENMVNLAIKEVKIKSDFQTKLISSSNNGIVATDEKGEIVIFNPGAEDIFGYTHSDIIRKFTYENLYPEDIACKLRQGLGKNEIMRGTSWRETQITDRNENAVPVKYSLSVLYEKGEVMGSVAFFQDMREVKRLEEELLKNERMAAIGQTVAGLAHYIKNILSGLKGGSYVLNKGLEKNDTENFKKGWEMVQNNISRISELVMDLLTYSKTRQPEPVNCSPNKIVDEVCRLMKQRAMQNNIEIIEELDDSIGQALMDENTIHNAVLNLVSNAIDACLYDEDRSKEWKIDVKTALINDSIIFEVSDNGCGMNDDVKAKIFTSFFSTKMGRGTGLGLLTTRKMVEEHGGKIEFTSEKGSGSTFKISLPLDMANAGSSRIDLGENESLIIHHTGGN